MYLTDQPCYYAGQNFKNSFVELQRVILKGSGNYFSHRHNMKFFAEIVNKFIENWSIQLSSI